MNFSFASNKKAVAAVVAVLLAVVGLVKVLGGSDTAADAAAPVDAGTESSKTDAAAPADTTPVAPAADTTPVAPAATAAPVSAPAPASK